MNLAGPIRTVCAAAGLVLCGFALAHTGATGIVKERMDAMSSIGDNMKVIGAMIKGEAAFDGKRVEAAARVIAGHAEEFPRLFPEGTNEKPSEALPAIWTDWDKFIGIATNLKKASIALAEAAPAASEVSDIRKPFLGVAGTCKACHADFRLKK